MTVTFLIFGEPRLPSCLLCFTSFSKSTQDYMETSHLLFLYFWINLDSLWSRAIYALKYSSYK